MRVIADLHIHSRYSRATSPRMCIEEINRFAKIKGLNIVGTGDFTHPKWLDEIKLTLNQDSNSGLYKTRKEASSVHFIVTTEVSTVYEFKNETKKIHHVIITPNVETAEQINDRLSKHGDLTIDGRPTLYINPANFVEEVIEVSSNNLVFPAHVWTPWFSLFGAFSGFDKIEDCYQDMTKHIHAIETGLSSDPAMNWRLSKLDGLTLVSNSDCHSFWPWRIGREANVFELEKITYNEIVDTINNKNIEKFKFTIETNPAYGKYHWTGHRKCNIAVSPQEAIKYGNVCPVCRKKFTKGVEQRIEELADRSIGFKPKNSVKFMHLLPLSEIIAKVLRVESLYTKQVWTVYNRLINKFGNEFTVLIDTSKDELNKVIDEELTETILKVREGRVKIVPGYDGVYGQLSLFEEDLDKPIKRIQQTNLFDYK